MENRMKLHENEKAFRQAILSTAEHLDIQKDYWVTYILKNLSQSEQKDLFNE